jgi:phage terminase small subunit
MARLSEKQEQFCQQYVVDFHVTNAAIRAGYSVKAASTLGSKLVKNGKIQARIAELRANASAKTGISLERILDQLGAMAHVDPAEMYHPVTGDLLPIHEMPEHVRRCIQSIEVDEIEVNGMKLGVTKKIKLAPREKAADMIMKHLGEYKKDNAQKQTNITVVVDIVDDDDPDQPTAEPDEVLDEDLDGLDDEI